MVMLRLEFEGEAQNESYEGMSGWIAPYQFEREVRRGFPNVIELGADVTAADGEVFNLGGIARVRRHCPYDVDGESESFSDDCALRLTNPNADKAMLKRLVDVLKSKNFDVHYYAKGTEGEYGSVTVEYFALLMDGEEVHTSSN